MNLKIELETLSKSRLLLILIIIGVSIPALLNLNFVIDYSVNTVRMDSWDSMYDFMKPFFENGKIDFEEMFEQQNENRIFFPHLIMFTIASLTAWNTFYHSLFAWVLLGVIVFLFWNFILKTIPQQKWIIIPTAWLVYSFSTWHSLIFGYSGVMWFLAVTAVLGSLYFQIKMKESYFYIIPVIILAYVSSFSYLLGLLVWPIGILSFIGKFPKKRTLLFIFVIAAIFAFTLYFNGWELNPLHPDPLLALSKPLDYGQYFLFYLTNGLNPVNNLGLDRTDTSSFVSLIIISLFSAMIFLACRLKERDQLTPWVQIGLMGLLAALVTGIGRLGFGVDSAFASKYYLFSSMFLIGTLGLSTAVFFYSTKNKFKSSIQKSIKIAISGFLILIIFYVYISDVGGWEIGVLHSKNLENATFCFVNYQHATDDCLKRTYPHDAERVRREAPFFKEYNLGPFADSKYIQFDDAAMFNLIQVYRGNEGLQSTFPEVLSNQEYSGLLCWAKNHGADQVKGLKKFYSYYEEHCTE